MFNQLLESKRKRQRSVGGALFSVALHTGLGMAAVYVTASAGVAAIEEKKDKVTFVEVKKQEEPPPPQKDLPKPPPDAPVTPPPPKGFQTLVAPIDIPNIIPPIDITKRVTNAEDFSGKGVRGGVAAGVVGGTGPVNPDTPLLDFQVEKVAAAHDNNPPPTYPSVLRTASIEGTVDAMYVVDTNGRADLKDFKVLNEANPLFVQAVKDALLKAKFYPAELGGQKVRQLVQQQFNFSIKR